MKPNIPPAKSLGENVRMKWLPKPLFELSVANQTFKDTAQNTRRQNITLTLTLRGLRMIFYFSNIPEKNIYGTQALHIDTGNSK